MLDPGEVHVVSGGETLANVESESARWPVMPGGHAMFAMLANGQKACRSAGFQVARGLRERLLRL